MGLNVGRLLSELDRMTGTELRRRYAEVSGEESRSGNRQWLIRRIAWRMQVIEEGDLPERARQRAMEIARDVGLRTSMTVSFDATHTSSCPGASHHLNPIARSL